MLDDWLRSINLLVAAYAGPDPSHVGGDETSNANLSKFIVVAAAIKAMHAVAPVEKNARILVEGRAIEQLVTIVGEHRCNNFFS